MFIVYILFSPSSQKTYTGYTTNLKRRIEEHNVTESRGFTLRYRPWEIILTEEFSTKKEAIEQEKFYKSGKGRDVIKTIVAGHSTTQNN